MKERKMLTMIRTVLISLLLLPVLACAEKNSDGADQIAKAEPEKAVSSKLQSELPQPATKTFTKDVHYVELFSPVPVETPEGQIEVSEMFWYGCPHCYKLDPHLKKWQATAAKDLQVVEIPGVLNPGWKLHAKAFYAAKIMGVFDKFHIPLFQTMHEQGRKVRNEDAMIRFVESRGIDGKEFLEAMNSMAVSTKVARAEQLGRQYGVTGVPALMVGGKYRVLGSGVRSYEEMFQVVDFLAEKIRQEK